MSRSRVVPKTIARYHRRAVVDDDAGKNGGGMIKTPSPSTPAEVAVRRSEDTRGLVQDIKRRECARCVSPARSPMLTGCNVTRTTQYSRCEADFQLQRQGPGRFPAQPPCADFPESMVVKPPRFTATSIEELAPVESRAGSELAARPASAVDGAADLRTAEEEWIRHIWGRGGHYRPMVGVNLKQSCSASARSHGRSKSR